MDRDIESYPADDNINHDGSHALVYFCEFQHWSSFFEDSKPTCVSADRGDEMFFVFGISSWSNHVSEGMMVSDPAPPCQESMSTGAPTLRVQPIVGQALKAHRFRLWMKTLPQKIQEFMEAKEKCTDL